MKTADFKFKSLNHEWKFFLELIGYAKNLVDSTGRPLYTVKNVYDPSDRYSNKQLRGKPFWVRLVADK